MIAKQSKIKLGPSHPKATTKVSRLHHKIRKTTLAKASNSRIKTKEPFRPENTTLNITLAQAYSKVREQQSCILDDLITKKPDYQIQKRINLFVQCKAARVTAVHRVISNKGIRSPGLEKWIPKNNDDYVYLVEKLRLYTKKPTLYRAKPLDRIYIPKKTNIDINQIKIILPLRPPKVE